MAADEAADAGYEEVRRRVLWGDEKEYILRELEEDGVPAQAAEELHAEAMAERVALLRGEARGRAKTGGMLLAGGAVLVVMLWHFTQGFEVWEVAWKSLGRRRDQPLLTLALVSGMMLLTGVWMVIDGAAGWLTAETRAGALADME